MPRTHLQVEAENAEDISEKYEVSSVPFFLFFKVRSACRPSVKAVQPGTARTALYRARTGAGFSRSHPRCANASQSRGQLATALVNELFAAAGSTPPRSRHTSAQVCTCSCRHHQTKTRTITPACLIRHSRRGRAPHLSDSRAPTPGPSQRKCSRLHPRAQLGRPRPVAPRRARGRRGPRKCVLFRATTALQSGCAVNSLLTFLPVQDINARCAALATAAPLMLFMKGARRIVGLLGHLPALRTGCLTTYRRNPAPQAPPTRQSAGSAGRLWKPSAKSAQASGAYSTSPSLHTIPPPLLLLSLPSEFRQCDQP